MFPRAVLAFFLMGQTPAASNLDFGQGSLKDWEGKGFALLDSAKGGVALVTSDEAATKSKTGMIRYMIVIPSKARQLRFQAYAEWGEVEPDRSLDIILVGEDNRPVPKQTKSASGSWISAGVLLPRWQGKPREYAWEVGRYAGQTMQIAILDRNQRDGCFVVAGGFRFIEGEGQVEDSDFAPFMLRIQEKHKLAPLARFESKHFVAIGNASDDFLAQRLRLCEIFYDLFYDHFRRKGFALEPPREKLALAVFDGPDGFDAYIGQKMPSSITGLYHTPTNRLVLYDLAENRGLQEQKKIALKDLPRGPKALQKAIIVKTIERQFDDLTKETNLSTTMHEAAHLLSFNGGMLNRNGDVAAWLAEGLACYCEATDQGDWTALGSPNPARIRTLHAPTIGKGAFIPLEKLVSSDRWLDTPQVFLGYSQSWALFYMLLSERPAELRKYLAAISQRRSPDARLADFSHAFGNDLAALNLRYQAFMREMVDHHLPQKAR
ncbi:MAG: DUF1570 domain-containing protein [Gemmataceae bacterium]|nr:DUF1570 domain-containing protein [Gemmataceae bacterium]MCI0738037.1 DUF1570 domain-containing protein [Gemmataceae bacterium]